MATENPWRARKLQTELAKLGIRVSVATISRYLPKIEPRPDQHQRWMTFLRNHKDLIAEMDSFVFPALRIRLLYVWFALDHGRRRVLHFNVLKFASVRCGSRRFTRNWSANAPVLPRIWTAVRGACFRSTSSTATPSASPLRSVMPRPGERWKRSLLIAPEPSDALVSWRGMSWARAPLPA